MGKVWRNIITFGAQSRIDKENAVYEGVLKDLHEINQEMESNKIIVNEKLDQVVILKKESIVELKSIEKITKHLKIKDREIIQTVFKENDEKIELKEIENFLTTANSFLNASTGVGAGLASSGAAVFLVGQLATASTGTAIGTLSGAAASNATLAWLGGGSIASGGGGMAAGSIVMGGIIVIPALAVMALLSHYSANKEIKVIKERELEAMSMIDDIKKNILALDTINERCFEFTESINKAKEVFKYQFKKIYREVYKIPLISRFVKFIRNKFGYNYYSEKDLKNISYIGKIASDFAKIIDSKIID